MTQAAAYLAAALYWRYTPTVALAAALAILAVAAVGRLRPRRTPAPAPRHARRPVADARAAYLAAIACTGVSLDTSWAYFGPDGLDIHPLAVHIALFSVLELILLTCGLLMRGGIRLDNRPGPARMVAWACCGMSAYMAWQVSGPLGGTARVILGPIGGLIMLHLALGIEVRARRGTRATTLARIVGELRERLISRLGLADDNRDALTRTRERAARRAARLILANGGTGRRTARAARASNVFHDPAARAVLLAELAGLKHLAELAELPLEAPWSQSAVRPVRIGDRVLASAGRADARGRDATASPADAPDAVADAVPDASDAIGAPDAVDAPDANASTSADASDAVDAYFSATVDADGEALAAASPPLRDCLTAGDAVVRADALLGKRTARQLASALAQVGVSITEGGVRTARSRAKRAAHPDADGDAHQAGRGAA